MHARCHCRIRMLGWSYMTVTAMVWFCALYRETSLLYLLYATMVGPLFFSWRQARLAMRDLSVERRVPRVCHAGQAVVVELVLHNQNADSSAWSVGFAESITGGAANALMLPAAADARDAAPPRVFFPHVGAGDERVESYLWRPVRRGPYTFAEGKLTSCFPLGLFETTRQAVPATELLVAPPLGKLKAAWRGWCDRAGREAAGASQRRGLMEGDYYGLREWRPGDSRRWIHWRSSARQGALTTLQFEQPRRDELFLVVDLWAPAEPTAAQREAVERTLSFATSVVVEFARRSDRVLRFGLAAAEPRLWREPVRAGERDELLDALALAEPCATPDLVEAAPAAESERAARSSAWPVQDRSPEGGHKTFAGVWAVASTRPADAAAVARFAAAGAPRGSGPLWIDLSSSASRDWFDWAGDS